MPPVHSPLNLVYFGSGEFGLPTLQSLEHAHADLVRLCGVVTQPDRPAGRGRKLTPTPVAQWISSARPDVLIIRPESTNDPEVVEQIRAMNADVFVVIAFGQKLGRELLSDTFAINLHASLLPKYRGAAPIAHAMINNEHETGVSVITLADRMDAGDVLATATTGIRNDETAGELSTRLASLGPEVMAHVLRAFRDDTLQPLKQDEASATRAPKLKKEDGTVDFNQSADLVRARIHGLNPWPGCTVQLNGLQMKIGRVRDHLEDDSNTANEHAVHPGTVHPNMRIACASGGGTIEILEIQPPGRRMMDVVSYLNAHSLTPGDRFIPAY